MTTDGKTLRTCKNGHRYYKSSDCITCPKCEEERKSSINFLKMLGAPARRALEGRGIATLQQLAQFSEADILNLHGMGKTSMPKLQKALGEIGLTFKQKM